MSSIRMSGLISNMDTDSVVEAMMQAHRLKQTKIENKKTKLEWTQDKWKELNTKLYKLYQEQTSKLHLVSNYKANSATSADESIVKVTADKNATQGTHSIIVEKLASSQYWTSNKLGVNNKGIYDGKGLDKNGNKITQYTKLSDIGITADGSNVISISAENGTKKAALTITDNTTIRDYVNACKSVGLNANYDEKQNRVFISSAQSGSDQVFDIKFNQYSDGQTTNRNEILGLVQSGDKASVSNALQIIEDTQLTDKQAFIDEVYDKYLTSNAITEESINKDTKLTADEKSKRIAILKSIDTINNATVKQIEAEKKSDTTASITTKVTEAIKSSIINGKNDKITIDKVDYEIKLPTKTELEEKLREQVTEELSVDGYVPTEDEINKKYELLKDKFMQDEYSNLAKGSEGLKIIDKLVSEECDSTTYQNDLKKEIDNVVGSLKTTMGKYFDPKIDKPGESGANVNLGLGSGFASQKAEDCQISYNGATLTSSSNSVVVNGLTIEAISISEKGTDDKSKPTSITVTKDAQGMYKMVKDFLTEYNTIIKSMNDLYYADSARGYDPLTSEEKEAMTDEQIKLWEDKIKNASLRRDSTLGGISAAMKQAMASSVTIDGKQYSLSSFGIMTSRDYTEKGLLHIYGDKDDATYSDQNDKLLKAIEEDPDMVAKVMAGIVDNLHTAMNQKMSKTSLSSALTFYNDKQMKDQVTQYKKDISAMETKLKAKETAYYKQFTAMEKAMATLQKQQSALSGLLG